jgi:hypothetical protein
VHIYSLRGCPFAPFSSVVQLEACFASQAAPRRALPHRTLLRNWLCLLVLCDRRQPAEPSRRGHMLPMPSGTAMGGPAALSTHAVLYQHAF